MAGFQQLRVTRKVDFTGAVQIGVGGNFDRNARVYYVNNITGSSTNDGLSWNNAMDELSTAITASETYRELQGTATNDYVRNTIVVQGTGTAYTAVTAIPNYTDIIGLGADPRGNGTGIAVIDGGGSADAMSVDSNGCRGLYMVNLQFNQSSQGNFYAADFAKLFRSRIESCVFSNSGYGGLRIVLGGGVVMVDISCTYDSLDQATGLTLGNGDTVNNCKIIDSEFFGNTQGVLFSAVAGKHTIFKDCLAKGGTYGFVDTSTQNDVMSTPFYVSCYGYGTASTSINSAGFKLTQNYASRAYNCFDNADGTQYAYPPLDIDG